jgi:hypothetical protein
VAACENVFVNLQGEAVSFQPHDEGSRRIGFHHNLVVGRGPTLTITITGGDPAQAERFRRH